ncbi:MAG: polyprenyl synthetase family protein [Patescibacteria group bacterium]|nr:polyprenyl synthetase family protein [Patescibacteria group bacterium]
MDALKLLSDYRKRLHPYLECFFNEKLEQAKEINAISEEAVAMIRDFTMAGGKRIRPAVMYYGYLAAGGTEREKMIKTSMSIELAHNFLLIHDDIIDNDELRHGIKTIHEQYKEMAQKMFPKTDPVHFGNSMAIVTGDMTASMSNEIMFTADFPAEYIVKALNKLQQVVYATIPGEMVDVMLEARGRATEEEIMNMYEAKTACYTFEGPLHLGAILAKANDGILKKFTDYSIPLGIAFQIRDDSLGIFGQQEKLGKPVGSDIIEGKQTILIVKALEMGDKEQRKTILRLLGKEDISESEIEIFRNIIRETGSLDYAYDLSDKLVNRSLEAFSVMDIQHKESKIFLEGIARFIIERQY